MDTNPVKETPPVEPVKELVKETVKPAEETQVSKEPQPEDPNLDDHYLINPFFYEVANYFGVEQKDFDVAKNKLSTIVDYVVKEQDTKSPADILHLPFKDSYADYVELFNVIEHFPMNNVVNYIKEIYRVMKPKAKLLILTNNMNDLALDWLDMLAHPPFDPKTYNDIAESTTPQKVNTASVFDSVTAAESTTPQLVNTASVFDSATAAETTTPQLVNTASVVDNATAAETTTLQKVNTASVFDSVTATENITILEANFVASVFDSVTVAETVIPQLVNTASVFDSVTIAEAITSEQIFGVLKIDVEDDITVSDPIAIDLPKFINVADNVVVSESVVSIIPSGSAVVIDSVRVSENVTLSQVNNIDVEDDVTVEDVVDVEKALNINVVDNVKASENLTVLLPYLTIQIYEYLFHLPKIIFVDGEPCLQLSGIHYTKL